MSDIRKWLDVMNTTSTVKLTENTTAGCVASGPAMKEEKDCEGCENYSCKDCFPELDESALFDSLREAGPDYDYDDVDVAHKDVDFDDVSKGGGVDDLGTDEIDLSDVDDVQGKGMPSEDVSRLIQEIDEFQEMGISSAKTHYSLEDLHKLPPEAVKAIHAMVCAGKDDAEEDLQEKDNPFEIEDGYEVVDCEEHPDHPKCADIEHIELKTESQNHGVDPEIFEWLNRFGMLKK